MKKKHPEHVNLERWLISYADFITLLFAFFVIMYAISQADISKFKAASASIRAAFDNAGPAGMIDLSGSAGGQTVNPFQNQDVPGGRMINLPAGKIHTAADPDPKLQETKELLEETISLELGVTEMSDKAELVFDSQGLIIRLAVKDFFDEGETAVQQDMQPILDRIGRILARTDRLIRIEGHADPSEAAIAGKKGFPSTWELSAARAAWVVKYWAKRFDMNPKLFSAAGHGHFLPLTSKTDPISRAKNRRVEIIILNNRYEK